MVELQKLLMKYCNKGVSLPGFLPEIFSGVAKSIVMQIYFVMLIFLLFSDQISGGKSLRGASCLRGAPPGHPIEKSQSARPGFRRIELFRKIKLFR